MNPFTDPAPVSMAAGALRDSGPAGVTDSAVRPYSPSAREASEETLMAAYAAGDEGAFVRLFASLAPSIQRFFRQSFRDRSVSDEMLQATFFRIHRARTSYRSELPLRPWVFTIAARVRQDELRRRLRLREDSGEDALAAAERSGPGVPEAGCDDELVEGDRAVRVRAALAGLPESQRVVVCLHRYEGMTFPEIAGLLGTSEVAVRGRAFRAYAQLRKQLGPVLGAGSK
jgi:RNA polymerase sigma-70 factor (ECF subfamily)